MWYREQIVCADITSRAIYDMQAEDASKVGIWKREEHIDVAKICAEQLKSRPPPLLFKGAGAIDSYSRATL